MSGGFTFDELRAEASDPANRRLVRVKVLLRQALLDQHAALEEELAATVAEDARENREPLAPALAERIAALEAEMDAARREFVFASVGKRRWADLLRDHPPSPEAVRVNPRLDHDPETFPSAAIAASCVSPTLTVDQALDLEELLNLSQWQLLWGACLEVNIGGGAPPKSVGAGIVRQLSAGSGRTAASEASPAASSLDGS